MPIVSTIAGTTLRAGWKNGSLDDGLCEEYRCPCCSLRQKWVRAAVARDVSPRRESIATEVCGRPGRVNNEGNGIPHASVVRRAPFRSLNGRAYAVPLSMLEEFDAIYSHVQRADRPPSRDDPLFSSLNSPGILWHHDPYSMKMINRTPSSSENQLSVVEEDEESGKLGKEGMSGGGLLFTTPQQPLSGMNILEAPHRHSKGSCGTFREERSTPFEAAAPMLQPSTRPMPSANGHCVFVRTIVPRSPQSQVVRGQQPLKNLLKTSPSNPLSVQGLTAPALGQVLQQPSKRRPLNGTNVDRTSTEKQPEDCPALLSYFRSLPPLFSDLTARMSRRPSRLWRRPGLNERDLASQPEVVSYVYLVEHRCRRSVCVASVHFFVGETVVLEGDMGIDMGTVRSILTVEEFHRLEDEELDAKGFPAAERDVVTAAFILRTATPAEVEHYNTTLCTLTADLLSFLRHRLNPAKFSDCRVENMEFLDCEFQADCKKVYVYYKVQRRVMFRELAQYLHSFYRCRIWLHEVGRGSSSLSDTSSPESGK